MKNSVPYELLGPDGQTHVFTSFPVAHADDDSDNVIIILFFSIIFCLF